MEKEEKEEKNNEDQEKEQVSDDSGEGDKPSTTPVIDEANAAAERMEKATVAQKAENDRAEALEARKIAGGRTSAGHIPPKPKKLSDSEYYEAVEKGEKNPFKEDNVQGY